MTIGEVLIRVDKLKPNALDEQTKAEFVVELERQLLHEFYPRFEHRHHHHHHGHHPGHEPAGHLPPPPPPPAPKTGPEKWPEDKNVPLSASGPYENIYVLYACAKVAYADAEYQDYENDMAVFQQAMDDFRKDYQRTHTPIPSGGVRHLL